MHRKWKILSKWL